jgi:hypothetical protein
MLAAVRSNERIIVGAYVDRQGGVCPMLAAHRRGGRTDFLSFAKSWDRFTRAGGKSRRATPREVAILAAQLEASLLGSSSVELERAISEHRALRAGRVRRARGLRRQAEPSGEIIVRRLRRGPVRAIVGDNVASGTAPGSLAPVSSLG